MKGLVLTRPILDHFSCIAPYYERLIPPGSQKKMLNFLGLSREHRVLDAGGGTGRVAQILRDYVAQIVVADISPGMLHESLIKDCLLPVNTPTENLPFADGSFDRVVVIDALHHVADRVKTAQELWRVLKPGGRIVIQEPDIRTFSVKLMALGEKLLLMRSHFLPPICIATLFDYPSAKINIDSEGLNIWIVVNRI